MTLSHLLQDLRSDAHFMANVMAWRVLPGRSGCYEPIPDHLHPLLLAALAQRGLAQLYAHQAQALRLAMHGADLALVTPTASGKTLAYTLPVLDTLLNDPNAHALCLFPTKALAHDQADDLRAWQTILAQQAAPQQNDTYNISPPFTFATYDGDTPANARATIRRTAQLILSNPDMLHTSILPYHTSWPNFFAGLRFVVLDEMHTYRGVFGSHVANVLRRLQRICALYGSRPQFIAASATIANPQQLAERLIERPVQVVTENGAPHGEKHVILYNPPVLDIARGLRRSSVLEAQELAARCVLGGVQTILFARARLTTEVLLTYLRDRLAHTPSAQAARVDIQSAIRGYRGGYLPSERRAIEAGLRNGAVRAVVTTNALELGIDIGQLQAAILCGYPGAIASAWQQIGRAGRTLDASLAIMVATGSALDQYVIRHPEFLFERSPEQALINPDNLMLLVDHMRCAAFEAPFQATDAFGNSPYAADVRQLLAEQGDLHEQNGRHFWNGEGYPATRISLRTTGSETVTIQVEESVAGKQSVAVNTQSLHTQVIGQVDQASATLLLHEGAIYLHEGHSYQVNRLDMASALAQVTPVTVDFYTQAATETQIDILATHEQKSTASVRAAHGDLRVQTEVVGFRRIKRFSHENLGVFPLTYPPQVIETTGFWFGILPAVQQHLARAGNWYDSLNDYGPNWQEQRERVRRRDGFRCVQCGVAEVGGRQHDVHHRVPFRTFGYVPGLNDHYLVANRLDNLLLVCRSCHHRLEATVRVQSGLDGLAYTLANLAPLHLMCAPQDLGVSVERAALATDSGAAANIALPMIFLYERAVAGLGFSARLFEVHEQLFAAAHELISHCPCPEGCPACVGPILEGGPVQLPTKRLTLALLEVLCGAEPGLKNAPHAEVAFA